MASFSHYHPGFVRAGSGAVAFLLTVSACHTEPERQSGDTEYLEQVSDDTLDNARGDVAPQATGDHDPVDTAFQAEPVWSELNQVGDMWGPPDPVWVEPDYPETAMHVAANNTLAFRIYNESSEVHAGQVRFLFANGDGIASEWMLGEIEVDAQSMVSVPVDLTDHVNDIIQSRFSGSAVLVFEEPGKHHRTSRAVYFHWRKDSGQLLAYDREVLESKFRAGDVSGLVPDKIFYKLVESEGTPPETPHVLSVTGSSDAVVLDGLHQHQIVEGYQ